MSEVATVATATAAVGAREASPQTQVPPNIILPSAEDKAVDEQIEKMMTNSGRNVNSHIQMQPVKLYPHHVALEINGVEKTISLMDFKQMLDQQLQIDTKLDPVQLPPNVYLFARAANMLQLSCYYPERRATLKHGERGAPPSRLTAVKDVLLPNVIITHTLKQDNNHWQLTDSRFLACSKTINQITDGTFQTQASAELGTFRMPYPNFYDDFRMCYGQNTPIMRYNNNLRGLDYFYQLIWEAPFNYDLGINVPTYQGRIPAWFDHLTKCETFPYELLSRRNSNW